MEPSREAHTGNESTRLREQLTAALERRGLIRSAAVRDAFLRVPRELFVPEFAAQEGLRAVYRDEAILTKRDAQGMPLSSSSQPAIMAAMLEQLELREGIRVLEVGAGTGYNAALLSLLVGQRGQVVSVDVDAQVAHGARRALRQGGYRARVVHADGRAGLSDGAPFDRIIVTASAGTVPHAWWEQLADDGLLEVPLRLDKGRAQVIPVFRKTSRGFRSVRAVCGGFMPLRTGDNADPPELVPGLVVSEYRGHSPVPPLLQLSGPALGTLSGKATRRLVATALGEPRRRPLGLTASAEALALYLALKVPRSRHVIRVPTYEVGVIGRDGRSLALIDARSPRVGVMKAYGGDEAELLLLEHVTAWDRRGRPKESDLQISVAYTDDGPRSTLRWPAVF